MGKMQRTKGAAYEREVAKDLTKLFGLEFKRVLGQERDGGGDVTAEGMNVIFECKRRRSLKGMHAWMQQAAASSLQAYPSPGFPSIPVVVCRGDDEQSLVVVRLNDLALLAAELMGDA